MNIRSSTKESSAVRVPSLSRPGARILVDQLGIHRVETIFGVPGESYLAVLDALYDSRESIRFITCRHEAGAGNMAEAWGKLTRRPGVCMVTRGPGASHAAVAIHTASQDSTPLLLFIGQVPRRFAGRNAFQEIDYARMFGDQAKCVLYVDDSRRIPEMVARAFTWATSGRPGPVVLVLPEDVMRDVACVADAEPYRTVRSAPAPEALAELRERLARSTRPLVVAGGGDWSVDCGPALLRFAQNNDLPIAAAFRRQDCVDNHDSRYVGDVGLGINPELEQYLREADLVLAVGPQLGEITTGGYRRLVPPVSGQQLIHIHPSPEECGRVYQPALAIASSINAACNALAGLQPLERTIWSGATRRLRRSFLRHTSPVASPGSLNLSKIVVTLRERLAPDAILTNGAGNYAAWVNRFSRFRTFGSQLAPTSGAMGYSIPAAIAAKLACPDRSVISFNGDGCFMMCAHELATAAQYDLNIVVIVVNNGMYGTIRMHQERDYPNRVFGTSLRNPDFVQLARSCGAFAQRVDNTADFAPAFKRAMASNRLAFLELMLDPEAIAPACDATGGLHRWVIAGLSGSY